MGGVAEDARLGGDRRIRPRGEPRRGGRFLEEPGRDPLWATGGASSRSSYRSSRPRGMGRSVRPSGCCSRAPGRSAALAQLHSAVRRRRGEKDDGSSGRIKLDAFFDDMVSLRRNREIGHGASGRASASYYGTMGPVMLAGVAELLGQLHPLAGRQLIHVEDVRRLDSGRFRVIWFELAGRVATTGAIPGAARRFRPRPAADTEPALPRPASAAGKVDPVPAQARPIDDSLSLRPLHPLVIYEAESGGVFFMNSPQQAPGRLPLLHQQRGDRPQEPRRRADRAARARPEARRRSERRPGDGREGEGGGDRGMAGGAEKEGVAAPGQAAPARLGDFTLISTLGNGRFGVVYRARHETLGAGRAEVHDRPGRPQGPPAVPSRDPPPGRRQPSSSRRIFTSGVGTWGGSIT